jgi:aminopeptidase
VSQGRSWRRDRRSCTGTSSRTSSFRFDAGRVTDVAATRGGNVFSDLFASDERARFLGEVALVDGNSPAAQLDGVFYNLLIDENAVSHIALGAAYAATMPDVREQTVAYRRALGLNDASVHVDIPIGGEAVDVDGIRNNEVVPILRGSEWLM